MSKKYNDYLQTDYWKAVSEAVKMRDGYRCRICNSPDFLEAHHRSYAHRGKEMEHLDDLTCLCRRCHGIFHRKMKASEKAQVVAPAAPVPIAGALVLITAQNCRCLKYNKETWQWMKRAGIKPKKRGWSLRAVGHSVPERFLW